MTTVSRGNYPSYRAAVELASRPAYVAPLPQPSRELDVGLADVQIRSATAREIDVQLLPWDTAIDTVQGREMFARGAFDDVVPDDVYLMGLEHEASMGLGQDGSAKLIRKPVGRGTAIDPGVPSMTFRVAKTVAGDELLGLAADRIVRGVSVEFSEVPGGTVTTSTGGRRVRTHRRVRLSGVSLTHRPAYGAGASVLAVRTAQGGMKP